MRSEVKRYHAVAMSLHWLIAFGILANLLIGYFLEDLRGADRFFYYQLHKSIGITVLLLSVLRLVWRLLNPPPAYPTTMKRWEVVVSHITHGLFYVLMIGVPLLGWLIVSASPKNIPTVLFWTVPWPNLPFDWAEDRKALSHLFGDLHSLFAYGTLGLLCLHVGAVLRHHWLMKDEILLRMTPPFAAPLLRFIRGEKT